jgi:hypothetical protein
VTIIAGIMFFGAAAVLIVPGIHVRRIGMIRGPWRLACCGLYIAAGVGLLKLSRWARAIVIVLLTIGLANQGIDLTSAALQERLRTILFAALGIPYYGLILWYLLTPKVRLTFSQRAPDEQKSPDHLWQ